MPITDIGKFMVLPNTDRNAIHFALLSAHAGIRKVIVLDHKTYTMLPPHVIHVQVYMQWMNETKAERKAIHSDLQATLKSVAGIGLTQILSIIEVFEEDYGQDQKA